MSSTNKLITLFMKNSPVHSPIQYLSGNNRKTIPRVRVTVSKIETLENCHFYKISNERCPSYRFELIPNMNRVQETRHSDKIPAIHINTIISRFHDYFIFSFYYNRMEQT